MSVFRGRSIVIGKAIYVIPYVGYVLHYAGTLWGLVFLVWIPAAALIAMEVRSVLKARCKESEKADGEKASPTPHRGDQEEVRRKDRGVLRREDGLKWKRKALTLAREVSINEENEARGDRGGYLHHRMVCLNQHLSVISSQKTGLISGL